MFLLAAIEGRCPFVDFPPVGQEKSGDIFLIQRVVMINFHETFKIQYVGQRRRERCIFSLARRKTVYGLDVAMFVSLIVT